MEEYFYIFFFLPHPQPTTPTSTQFYTIEGRDLDEVRESISAADLTDQIINVSTIGRLNFQVRIDQTELTVRVRFTFPQANLSLHARRTPSPALRPKYPRSSPPSKSCSTQTTPMLLRTRPPCWKRLEFSSCSQATFSQTPVPGRLQRYPPRSSKHALLPFPALPAS